MNTRKSLNSSRYFYNGFMSGKRPTLTKSAPIWSNNYTKYKAIIITKII